MPGASASHTLSTALSMASHPIDCRGTAVTACAILAYLTIFASFHLDGHQWFYKFPQEKGYQSSDLKVNTSKLYMVYWHTSYCSFRMKSLGSREGICWVDDIVQFCDVVGDSDTIRRPTQPFPYWPAMYCIDFRKPDDNHSADPIKAMS